MKRRVLGSAALGLGAALVLAGCGAGQITQTSTMLPSGDGAIGQVGAVSVRGVGLVNTDTCEQAYAPGSDAPLKLTIVNDGPQDDELVSVSSENAASGTVAGDKTIPGRTAITVAPTAAPTHAADISVGQAMVTLRGLKSVVWPGQLIPVTFTFRDAGQLTVEVPVSAPPKTLSCPGVPTAVGGEAGH